MSSALTCLMNVTQRYHDFFPLNSTSWFGEIEGYPVLGANPVIGTLLLYCPIRPEPFKIPDQSVLRFHFRCNNNLYCNRYSYPVIGTMILHTEQFKILDQSTLRLHFRCNNNLYCKIYLYCLMLCCISCVNNNKLN